jgi:hypothetical protein
MSEFALTVSEPKSELTPAQFMTELRTALKRASNLSDAEIAEYTQNERAWLEYQLDGYNPAEAVEDDMSYWD